MIVCVGDASGILRMVAATGSCGTGETEYTLQEATPLVVDKTVFVSSVAYTVTELGDVNSAHTKCQTLATNAGLAGTYKAWISDDTYSPLNDFTQASGKYKMVDGTVIANNWADLVDGTLSSSISKTESGGSTAAAWGYTWTGTADSGAHYANNDCTGWTATSGVNGRCGKASLSTDGWTSFGFCSCGSMTNAIYCFEQ